MHKDTVMFVPRTNLSKNPCRVSNRPELGGIVPILLENPDSTSVWTRVSQFWRTALTSQRAEKYIFAKLS